MQVQPKALLPLKTCPDSTDVHTRWPWRYLPPLLVTGMLRLSFLLLRKGQSGHRNKSYLMCCTCIGHIDRRSYEAAEGRAAFEEIGWINMLVGAFACSALFSCCAPVPLLTLPLNSQATGQIPQRWAVRRERGKNGRLTLLPKLDNMLVHLQSSPRLSRCRASPKSKGSF